MTDWRYLQSLYFYFKILTLQKPLYRYNKITYKTDINNINTRFRGTLSLAIHRNQTIAQL